MSNNFEFDFPRRQSYVAIIIIIYKLYKTLVRQLWPFLILMFFGGNLSKNKSFVIGIGVLAVLSTIYGIISFFKYFFFIKGDELIVEKGVIKKSKITIPLSRIQSVDFEQNIIHRMFNVVKLKIDTAGSSGSELNLSALDMEKANDLRTILLQGSKAASAEYDQLSANSIQTVEEHVEEILHIKIWDLLKVGITANHLKSAWLIFFFFFWIYENLEDVGIDLDPIKNKIPDESLIMQSIALILTGLVFFIITAFVISVVRTVMSYFDLRLTREKEKFKITSGLLNRREVAALDNKVQLIQWTQNMLEKPIGLFRLKLKQASSAEVKLKSALLIPGIKAEQIQRVNDYLFEEENPGFDDYLKTDIAYFFRNSLYLSLGFIPFIFGAFYFGSYKTFVLLLLFYLYFVLSTYLSYRKFRLALNSDYLKLNSGAFADSTALMLLYKLQAVELTQNIYQRRKSLADIKFYNAAGSISIPYVPLSEAKQIVNYCLYKIEVSNKSWM